MSTTESTIAAVTAFDELRIAAMILMTVIIRNPYSLVLTSNKLNQTLTYSARTN